MTPKRRSPETQNKASQHHRGHRGEINAELALAVPVTVTLDGDTAGRERESLTQTASTGLFWHGANVVTKGLVRFLTTVLLARALLPRDFGILGMALLVNDIVSLLGGLSLGAALIQKKDADERDFDTAFWANVVVGVGLGIGFLAVAPCAGDRKSTRLNSSHIDRSRMPSSA